MQQGWDSEALNWAYFARTPGHDHAHENINWPAFLKLLPAPGRRTLDLGCGEGRLGRDLRSRGYRVVGADASAAMVRLAQGHEAAAPSFVADATALPFAGEAFDLVVAYMVLHDIDRMPEAVAEIGRVLSPGGVLCMAIVHPLSSAGKFPDRTPDAPFVIDGSYMEPAPVEMTVERDGIRLTFHSEHRPLEAYSRALEGAGMRIEAIREVSSAPDLATAKPSDYRWTRLPLFLHIRATR
ncbi:MAG: class I SAM-dependent methyltransferase [Trebonia sp.]